MTPENLHQAAAGMTSWWYRNTEAIETYAHADWDDADMLRRNTWVTRLCLTALTDVTVRPTAARTRLEELLDQMIDQLPNETARTTLREEKSGAPSFAATWIATNGLGNYLKFLAVNCPGAWWGSPQYSKVVATYQAMTPAPPGPDFTHRMLTAPWELSDEQADYVCLHRYDAHPR